MAPRKQTARATDGQQATTGSSQRPRRTVQPKESYVAQPSDSGDSPNTSGSEAEKPSTQLRGRPARGTQSTEPKAAAAAASAQRRSQRAAPARGAAAAPATQQPARAAVGRPRNNKPAAEAREPSSSSGLESNDESSDGEELIEVEEQQPKQTKAPGRGAVATRAAAKASPPPPPLTAAGPARRVGAAKLTAAPAAAAATLRPDGPRSRQPAAAANPQSSDGSEGDDESGEGDDEEEEEEGEEEAERSGLVAVSSGRAHGGGRGRGTQSMVPPTSQQSRKRLFELLERRIGTTDGNGSSRRVLYGELPPKNPNKKSKLLSDLRSQFDDWHSRLRSNFSVLLYGFGSKRGLLEDFAHLMAGPRNRGDAAVLVFHGYNHRCTARDVVVGVAGALMQRTFRTPGGAGGGGAGGGAGGPAALRALVDEIRIQPLDRHAFVVIHNIDGPGLRGDVSLISALAACPQVHVIASMDHALAPLLWDSADAARFRWQYINATTFQPYLAETTRAQSVLMGAFKSGVVTAGAGTVLRSLVLGAQEVFKLLADHLLEDEECEGVAFAHLYRMCRERFLVRDERVLRQHLVEFVDHQLVRLRPASDNSGELLTIPMARSDIVAVLSDLAAARVE